MIGVIKRKNLIMLFFATEIMLNAVNIGMAAISKFHGDLTGQMFAFFIVAIAASEVAVGLGLLILWFKRHNTLDLDSLQKMKG
jgi:NADH-quinone oxidoreductase subunit K